MQLVYGSAAMPVNGAETTVRVRTVLAPTGLPLRYVARVDVKVWLIGNGQAELTALENTLNAALLIPYQNLILFQDSGAPSGTKLINNASISGVRVVDGPNYQNEARDGEYVTQRTAQFSCEAEYLIPAGANATISWTDSVSITGDGGPVYSWRQLINAPPIQQVVYPASTVKVTQHGSAVGHLGYPTPPAPLWPRPVFMGDRSSVTHRSPKRLGQGFIEWPVSWNYVYEGLGPLVAPPTLPPL